MNTQPKFAVFRTRDPVWDHNKPMRQQDNWDQHARYIDALTNSGFILMGGPLGDGRQTLLIISAESEQQAHEWAIRQTLAQDPWETADLLTTQQIHPWTILLNSRTK